MMQLDNIPDIAQGIEHQDGHDASLHGGRPDFFIFLWLKFLRGSDTLTVIFPDEGKHAVRQPAHRERGQVGAPQQVLIRYHSRTVSG